MCDFDEKPVGADVLDDYGVRLSLFKLLPGVDEDKYLVEPFQDRLGRGNDAILPYVVLGSYD